MKESASNEGLISVITPSYGQGEFIEDCLDSVKRQTHARVQHLVIDGGSSDTTLDVLRRQQGRPGLHWASEPDRGQAHAINKGLELARGEIVCWLNADDTFFDRHVLRKVDRVFREHPAVQLLVGDGYRADRAGRLSAPIVLDAQSLTLERMRYADFVLQPSAFWRRNSLRLEESYRYAFDWLFFLEMFERGLPVLYLREYLSVYRSYGSNKTALDNAERKRELARILRRNLGRFHPSTLFGGLVYAGYRLAEILRLPPLKRAVRLLNGIAAESTRHRLGSG